MIKKRVLHGDLSPNNLIIHEGQGYFVDFDHAKILDEGGSAKSNTHGTVSPKLEFAVVLLIS